MGGHLLVTRGTRLTELGASLATLVALSMLVALPMPATQRAPDNALAQWHTASPRTTATAPVGSHPQGDSKWGLHDLAGNVWEWTSTSTDEVHHEIRGGGWNSDDPTWLRGDYSVGLDSREWIANLGFRCAL
ncbi:MAG: SUMF1/EgtB/PvdO family nonheme iron enzyme [Deltaproteobacteria bacterium]|nr:SUMF1/EgtB/PvdO family nonheme iron enzyme [Deltaproteobacteria bacterium]